MAYTFDDIDAVLTEHGMVCLLAYLTGQIYNDNQFQESITKGIAFLKHESGFENCLKKEETK